MSIQNIPLGIFRHFQVCDKTCKFVKPINSCHMKHNSRDYILEKAAPVFNQYGFSGTSLAAICAATGMTKGSIYANFKDKDALGVAVFNFQKEQINNKLNAVLSLKEDSHEQLLLMLDFYQNAHK